MNKALLSLFVAATLAACSSTPTKQAAAPVSEGNAGAAASTAPAQDKMPEAQPMQSGMADSMAIFPPKGVGGALGERSIYYDFDKYNVKTEYAPIVSAHAGFLGGNAKAHLTLQGNCDERGSREYNLALGSRRAEGVKTLMTASGASADQIEVISFGKEKPMAMGHDEAAWSKNRRVDIVYQGE